ncbi:MAG TPA: hypothetical protein VHH88_05865 [Verrucomicrobiae bacterium]|nr:hypothetical protein [Verrucomicrobiae bacterium]
MEISAKPQGKPTKSARGYEARDASTLGIFTVVAFLCICAVAMHLALLGMIHTMKKQPFPVDRWNPAHPAALPPQGQGGYAAASILPPTNGQPVVAQAGLAGFPRLQILPPAELKEFRTRQEEELNSYGWVDRTAGVVRIPIERAMDLALKKGFPEMSSNGAAARGVSSLQLQQQRPFQSNEK